MTAPTASEPPTGEPPNPLPPLPPAALPGKFVGLAWSSLILGIVGVVFSPMPIINNLSAMIAVVGIILALIALFGSRKVLAGIGAGLCVLAIVFTVAAQTALTKGLSGQGGTVGRSGGSGQQASNDAAQHIPFGQSFTYEDGTVVTIAAPTSYQPSSTALVGSGAARAVAMNVTVTNGTVKPLNLALMSIRATAGEQAVEQVYDTAKSIGGTPSQTLPPGNVRPSPSFSAYRRSPLNCGWRSTQACSATSRRSLPDRHSCKERRQQIECPHLAGGWFPRPRSLRLATTMRSGRGELLSSE